jgi:hypothetical protein
MTPPEGFSTDTALVPYGEEEEGAAPVMTGAAPARVDYTVRRIAKDAQARKRLALRVCEEFRRYDGMTEQKRDLVRELRKDWEMLEAADTGPWDGASRVRAPHIRLGCDQHELRLNTLITGPAIPFSATARKPEAVPLLPEIEESLSAILEETCWKDQARETHREIQIAPVLVRVTYEQETACVPRLNVEVNEGDAAELVAAGVPVDQALAAATKRDRKGEIQVDLEWEEITTFDGVKIGIVPFEDLVVLPVSTPSKDGLWGLGERVRLRGMDLRAGVESGKYLKDAVERLLLAPGDPLDEDDIEDAEDYAALDLEGGQYENALYREYDCVELCWKDDLDGSGKMKWHIVTVHLESETVLRCQYSPYEHGRPYYVLFNYMSRSRQVLGQSTADLLATTQASATAALNNFHDLASLLVGMAGSFFYDEDSEFDPKRHEIRPGLAVPCRDPQKNIKGRVEEAGTIPPGMLALREFMDMCRQDAERLAATSNPTMGVGADDATTATEVKVVAGNADARFENQAAGVALQWKEVWDLVRWTAAQYADGGRVRYRRSASAGADPEWSEVASEVLKADVDLVPTALREWSDPQTRVMRDQFVAGIVAADPILAADLELKLLLLKQMVQDIRHPQAQQIIARAEQLYQQALVQMQMMQMMGGAMAVAGAQAQGEQMAKEEGRAQEQHELGMAQGQMGIMQQAQQMMQPPPMPAANGNGKGKK